MNTRPLSVSQLKAIGACREAISKFRELFGETVDVTEERAAKHASDFDFSFAARLLSAKGCAAYERVTSLAWAEYKRVEAPAWAEYKRVEAPAWARLYVSEGT